MCGSVEMSYKKKDFLIFHESMNSSTNLWSYIFPRIIKCKYTIVEFLFGFVEEEKLNVGGGKCEIDAPQSNKCEFNHSSHITFTFAFFSIDREKFTKWLFLDVWSFQERFLKVQESDIEGLNTLNFRGFNLNMRLL